MEYRVKTIPHRQQEYDTCGNYWEENGVREIRISEMGNEDYEFLVFIHEAVEQYLAYKRGISNEAITEFDKQFERERKRGLHAEGDEPGYDRAAPYHREHRIATIIEQIISHELDIDWKEYESVVEKL